MNKFLLDNGLKKEIAEEKLRGAKALVSASTKDGIVFVTENPSIIRKTTEIYDRIGLGIIGSVADIKKIKRILIDEADKKGFFTNPQDVHFRPLVESIASFLEETFSDPRVTSFGVKMVLAEIGSKPQNDKILLVDYEGGVGNLKNEEYVILAAKHDILKEKIKNLLSDNEFHDLDADQAIDLIKNAISQTRENDNPLTFEISILKRSKSQRQKFERLEQGRALS